MCDALGPISSTEAARAYLQASNGDGVSAMKMHKLVYMAHENHIAVTGMPFISDRIEAWRFGPVFPKLAEIIGNEDTVSADVEDLRRVDVSDGEVVKYVKNIWDNFKDYSGMVLSEYTHSKGSPWYIARNPPRESLNFVQKITGWKPKHPVIEDAVIRRYCLEMCAWRSCGA